MLKGKEIFIKQGFRLLRLNQSPLKRCLNQTRIPEYPAFEELPLPSNIGDLACSEKLKFSPQRNREISGSYIKFSVSSNKEFLETNTKIQEDERLQCYDCSGTINLSSAMQTNVPFPFRSREKPTHLNMPGGQWAQYEKYTSEDLNNLHHANSKKSTTNGGTSFLGGRNTRKNSFLCFSAMDLRTCDCLQPSFNVFSYHLRNFCSNTEKVVNVDTPSNNKVGTSNVSQLSRREKLKLAVRDYGSVILVFHIGMSLLSLGCCYYLVASGVNISAIFKDWGVEEGATAAGTATQFVVAYAVHKSLAPARIAITLSVAPFVVKKLRKRGLLKAPGIKVQ